MKTIVRLISFFIVTLSIPVFADVTYSLHLDGVDADIAAQITVSVQEAVALYNKHGSFNKHLDIYYNPGTTAESNYDGYIGFGSMRHTRVALHEMGHTMGIGTHGNFWANLFDGMWQGYYGRTLAVDLGYEGIWGGGIHIWPGGMNYDNEDGFMERIQHVRIMAAMRCDMGIASIFQEPVSQIVQAGDTAIFSIVSPTADSYQWYKGGVALSNGGDISGANGPTLQIANADLTDEGNYYCVVTGANETLNSRTRRLIIQKQVGQWNFEGNANDSVGSYHGTTTGSPAYTTGKIGQSIVLDGTDDSVVLPAEMADAKDITVAVWVYWNGGGQWQRIFDFGTGTSQNLFLTPRSGANTLRFAIKNGGGEQIVETSQLATGQWVHVAITLRNDGATLYVNGRAAASNGSVTIDPVDFMPAYSYIGDSQYSSDPLFNGRIDDFLIYNYALSGSDVWDLWGQSANHAPTFSNDWLTLPNATEDAAYSGQTLAGFAGDVDGGTLTYSKVSGPAWLTVAANGTLSGTPVNSNVGQNVFVVRVTDSTGATDDASLEITVLNTNDAPIWSANPIVGSPIIRGMMYTGTLEGLGSDIDAGDSITYSKVAGPAWLTIAGDGTLSGSPDVGNVGLNSFTVRVTDSASSYSDVTLQITVNADVTLAWWTFEEGTNGAEVPGTSGWTTYQVGTPDMSGNGNHLCDYWNGPNDSGITYSSSVPTISGISNTLSGLSEGGGYPSMFTWSSQSAPVGVDLENAVLSAWTIEAFIYPTAIAGQNRGIVGRDGKRSSTDVAAPLYFNIQGGGQLHCTYYDQAAVIHGVQSSVTLTTNRWYYAAATCDGTTLKLWLADITGGATTATQVASVNVSGSANPDFGPWPDNRRGNWSVFRGYWNSGDVDRFMGNIDQVRISAAALNVNTEGLLVANTAPSFIIDPIGNIDGIELTAYAGNSLATYAQDAEGLETVTFSKDIGPAWLNVASNGTLSGIPGDSDVGENTFTVRVTDYGGLSDTAAMTIQVANTYSGVQGINDLLGLASQWLFQDCVDIPACGGADLNGDKSVTLTDLAVLASHWGIE